MIVSTEGIEAVYLTTHNWGRAAKFFQSLGYELEFDTGHSSGQLRNGAGPSVFIAEVPADHELHTQIVLRVADAGKFQADEIVEVVKPFEETHYGTKEMTVRDPDGRQWTLSAPNG
jgi:hypothetical protein